MIARKEDKKKMKNMKNFKEFINEQNVRIDDNAANFFEQWYEKIQIQPSKLTEENLIKLIKEYSDFVNETGLDAQKILSGIPHTDAEHMVKNIIDKAWKIIYNRLVQLGIVDDEDINKNDNKFLAFRKKLQDAGVALKSVKIW